ncbi:hypothetical protein [Paraburkholderia youngii]|uniref:hypothetical protein n=1 Tax=Paraburkholderia youngii TaxID=2782701 RepID=UPI003D23FA9A
MAMLLDAQRFLPGIAAEALQTRDLLNGVIEKQTKEIDQRVEAEIKSRNIPAALASTWRAISAVRFSNPKLNTPRVSLGRAICSEKDSRGVRRSVGVPLIVCDFLLSVEVVGVEYMYLSFPDGKGQLRKSRDGFKINEETRYLHLFANVYPLGAPLGEVALHLAEVTQALAVVRAEEGWSTHEQNFPFFMTNDPDLYEALAPQYDGCLDLEGAIVAYDFRRSAYYGIGEPSFHC